MKKLGIVLLFIVFIFSTQNCVCKSKKVTKDECKSGYVPHCLNKKYCQCKRSFSSPLANVDASFAAKNVFHHAYPESINLADAVTTYTIIVNNKSPNKQSFYLFQKPAVYTGGPDVYSNSVASRSLEGMSGGVTDQAVFTLQQQYYAGAQNQPTPITVGKINTASVSLAQVQLNGGAGTELDSTKLYFNSDSIAKLSPATSDPNVMPGAFRIVVPSFQPGQGNYNIGLGMITNGVQTLSSFVAAEPYKNYDIQPVVQFYVATGDYTAGTVINIATSSIGSYLCDATTGQFTFYVDYNANGKFTAGSAQ